jgi:hypothetical protein
MRAAFVLGTVVLAVALGVLIAVSGNGLASAAVAAAFVWAIWAVSRGLERALGHGLWHFGAPYVYRSIREPSEAVLPPPAVASFDSPRAAADRMETSHSGHDETIRRG